MKQNFETSSRKRCLKLKECRVMLPGLDTVTAAVGHHNCCHDLRLDTNIHPGIFSPFQTRDGNKNESKDNDPKPK